MLSCRSCSEMLQQDSKFCPQCGNSIQIAEESSFDITNSAVLIKQTDESQTVDKSVQFSGNVVSGPVTIGETVNITNITNYNVRSGTRDMFDDLQKKMDIYMEMKGLLATPSIGEPRGLSEEQSRIATVVREKVKQADEKFGSEAIDSNIFIRLARADYKSREYNRAIANLDKAIQSFPTKVETLLRTATNHPNHVTISVAYFNRGVCYGELENHEQAIQDYNEAINWDSKMVFAFINRGLAYDNLGEHEKAISNYDKAEILDPKDPDIFFNRGNAYAIQEQYARAIEDYDHAIDLNPRDAASYCNRGNCYDNLGEHKQASESWTQAININPTMYAAHCSQSGYYMWLGDYEHAIQSLDTAITIRPRSRESYIDRGYAKTKLGMFDEAIKDFAEAIKINPENHSNDHFFALARAGLMRNQGDFENALSNYDIALVSYPKFVDAYLDRGTLYQDLGKLEQAIQDYTEGIRLCQEWNESLLREVKFKGTYALAYALRGFAYREIGKSKEASQDLEKSAELGNSSAIEFLAQNSTTSKHTSKWGWFKSNFGGEAAQRRAGMNPLQQTKDVWGALKELREIKGTHKSGEESNDEDSDANPRN